jgi:hypothetical protein
MHPASRTGLLLALSPARRQGNQRAIPLSLVLTCRLLRKVG